MMGELTSEDTDGEIKDHKSTQRFANTVTVKTMDVWSSLDFSATISKYN